MKRLNFNIKDRKVLTLGLCLVAVCVFTLTIAYAALVTTLNISGYAQVSASNWNIHLANAKVKNGSATTTVPTITSGNTLNFSTTLTTPGDFFEFTVDVVNAGEIDAMIEKVVKTPELTAAQAKYLKYEVSYQNGESINSKQNIAAGTTTPLKVRIEYRKDLVAADLPTTSTTLDMSITLDYIQSDGTGSDVKDNGLYVVSVDGDINDIGTIVTIGSEQFYTIGTEGDTVKLLSKYNLHVGYTCSSTTTASCSMIENPTGLQNSSAGNVAFSYTNYWVSKVSTYPTYVYDSNSALYPYVENYKNTIEWMGVPVVEARLITYDELVSDEIGCTANTCTSSPYSWIYSTTYWSGSVYDSERVWGVGKNGFFGQVGLYYRVTSPGLRPVIVISKDLFN